MKSLLLVIAALATIIAIVCSPNCEAAYDPAIQNLIARVNQDPYDGQARIFLASALAAKNGLVLSRFMGFARILINWNDRPKSSADSGSLKELSAQIDMIINAIHAVPEINGEQAVSDLHLAVDVLQVQGVQFSLGEYLYRALLKLVIFKYDLNNTFRLKTTASCQVAPAAMIQWLQNVDSSLTGVLQDVALATKEPKKKEKLTDLEQQIQDIFKEMEKGTAATDPATTLIDMPQILQKIYPTCG